MALHLNLGKVGAVLQPMSQTRDKRTTRGPPPQHIHKPPTLKGTHKGDSIQLKYPLDKAGLWEANMNFGTKVRCVVAPKDSVIHAPTESSLEIFTTQNPTAPAHPADPYNLSRGELIAAIRALSQGVDYFLHQELDSIRADLEAAERELHQLVRIWTNLYGDNSLLEKLKDGYGYTEVEKTKVQLISDPYICILTPQYIKETPPSKVLQGLAEAKKEIVLAPSNVQNTIYTLLYPTFNLNSISKAEVDSLLSLKFNVLAFDRGIANTYERENHMVLLLMHMFLYHDLIREFNIPEDNLYRFIGTIGRKYRNVPFHCFYHGFNVTQTMFYFLTTCNLKKVFGDSKLEIFACLVACLIHDCDHPGLNNTFQKKYNSKLSTVHAASILENHHLNQGLCVMSQPDCDILCGLTETEVALFHTYVHRMVMATDLAFHKHILEELNPIKEHIAAEFQKDKPSLDPTQTLAVLAITMKCSDLSNEIRPCDIAFLWAARVTNEFFQQTDKERELGLPVTSFMDPEVINPAQEQGNFINGLCKPLYGVLHEMFPTVLPCLNQMSYNLAVWEQRRLDTKTPLCVGRSGWEEDQAAASMLPFKLANVVPRDLTASAPKKSGDSGKRDKGSTSKPTKQPTKRWYK